MQRGEILMQNQITKRTRLLDAQGNVAEPGYCVHNPVSYTHLTLPTKA